MASPPTYPTPPDANRPRGWFAAFLNWLTTTPRRERKDKHPDIRELDVQEIAVELGLEAKGHQLGAAGLPPADAEQLTGPESAAIQHVEKARQDFTDWANGRLHAIDQQFAQCNVVPAVNEALQLDREFERRANEQLTAQRSTLSDLRKIVETRGRELADFRERNKLTRDAHLSTLGESYLHYGVLLFLVVVEGIANAFFFSRGLSTGLIGGFAMAAIFAAVNVLVAYVLGRFFIRNVHHVSGFRKAFGVISALAAIAAAVGISLVIAHYRDQLTQGTDPQAAAQLALAALVGHPFRLHDVLSWVLFSVSFVFAMFALADGYTTGDRYPGYERVARADFLAREDFELEAEVLRENLTELKDEVLAKLTESISRARGELALQRDLILHKGAVKTRYRTACDNAENCLAALLTTFRDANRAARGAIQVPGYFDQKIRLRPLTEPNFDVTANERHCAQQQELVDDLLRREQSVKAAIQAAFTREFSPLTPFPDHFV